MLLVGFLSFVFAFAAALESTPTTIPPLNPCALECYINVSFATEKNETELENEIGEVLSFEFQNNTSENYLYLKYLKLIKTNHSVTYWFNLFFQRPYCDGILKQEVLAKSQQLSKKSKYNYTILPNSLQIKPFEIPPSRNKLLSLEMKLKGNFTKELKVKSSEEFKILEYKIIKSLTFLMESIQGFVKVIINDFEEGSIVVKAQLLFDSDKVKVTDEELKKDTEIKLIRYLGKLNDSIDEYKIDSNSFKINGNQVVPEESSSFPAWAIIIFLSILLPITFACVRQQMKIKKLKGVLQSFIITKQHSQINGNCGTNA